MWRIQLLIITSFFSCLNFDPPGLFLTFSQIHSQNTLFHNQISLSTLISKFVLYGYLYKVYYCLKQMVLDAKHHLCSNTIYHNTAPTEAK